MSARRILLLGNLEGSAMAAVEGAARQTNSLLSHHTRADDAIRELDAREWRAVLVDITTPGASRFCQEARARRALFNVPLVGLTPQLTDLAFANAFRWGADDLVQLGLAGPLAARLLQLPEEIQLENPARGEAVVADADRGRCDVLGRVLANAGYTVRYAMDLLSTRYYLRKREVTLFVLNEELGAPPALIEEARALGNEARWVIAAKQLRMEAARDALKDFDGVAVMGSHGPPENVLFALDYVNRRPGARRRSQIRTLHGTIVHFRGEGEEEDECGYTYSVSEGGLYVRTLLPAPPGNLWLELEPPKVTRRVRLLGSVVWTRPFGKRGAEMAPPGFGVKLLSGLGEDLSIWQSGWNRLDGSHPDSHAVPEVKFTPEPFRVPLPESLSQPPRAPYISRKSAPIIAVGGRRASDELPAVGATRTPGEMLAVGRSVSDEMPAVTLPVPPPDDVVPPPGAVPAPKEPPSTTVPMGLRIRRPDAEQLRNSLAPRSRRPERDVATAPLLATVEVPSVPLVEDRVDVPADTEPVPPGTRRLATPESVEPTADTEPVKPKLAAPAELGATLEVPGRGPDTAAVPPPKARREMPSHHEGVPPPVTVLTSTPVESTPPPPAAEAPGVPLATAAERSAEADPARTTPAPPESSSAPATETQVQPSTAPGRGARIGTVLALGAAAAVIVGLYWMTRRERPPELAAATQAPAGAAQHAPADPGGAPANPREAEQAGPLPAAAEPLPAGGVQGPAEGASEPIEGGEAADGPPPGQGPSGGEAANDEATKRALGGEAPTAGAPSVAKLGEDETWVRVKSSVDAVVFIHGIDLGRTNQWLRSRCGMRFIRLGSAPGQWLSEGVPQPLPCRRPTTIALEPTPEATPTRPAPAP